MTINYKKNLFPNYKDNLITIIFFSVFTFIGLTFFIVGSLLLKFELDFKARAVEAQAVITNIRSGIRHTSSGGETAYDVTVEFTVDGRVYSGPLGYYSSGMREGQSVTVRYDRDDPRNFHSATYFLPLLFMSLGAFFAVIGLAFVTAYYKKKRKIAGLIADGKLVNAEIIDVIRSNMSINHYYGRHVICEWNDHPSGTKYIFKSENTFMRPERIIAERGVTHLPVYLDYDNYRKYYVDISQLSANIVDLT